MSLKVQMGILVAIVAMYTAPSSASPAHALTMIAAQQPEVTPLPEDGARAAPAEEPAPAPLPAQKKRTRTVRVPNPEEPPSPSVLRVAALGFGVFGLATAIAAVVIAGAGGLAVGVVRAVYTAYPQIPLPVYQGAFFGSIAVAVIAGMIAVLFGTAGIVAAIAGLLIS